MRTIDVNRLISFCETHTIDQVVSGKLLVKVGETKRGDAIYKDLLEFEEIYTPLPEGKNESSQGECCGSCYLCDVGDCKADLQKGGGEE